MRDVRNVVNKSFLIMEIFISRWLSKCIMKVSTNEYKSEYREIEKIATKIVKDTGHLAFNEACIQHNLLPTYTNIYIYI